MTRASALLLLTFVPLLAVVPVLAQVLEPAVKADFAHRTWQGIPGLTLSAKGRVFVSWFTGGKQEPSPDNTVYLCQSDDAAKTFTEPLPMAGPKSGSRAFDPTLWIDPDGRLWYIFNRGNKESAEHGVYARRCDDPDATPLVWTDEFRVGYEVPFSFRINKPTILSTGEWIMPVTHAKEVTHAWFADKTQLQGVGISTDKGRTWSLHGALKAPPWALENLVVECLDRSLWMFMRNGSGFLWESMSTDKGRTWSEPRATSIPNPGSRFFFRRLASGHLLLVNQYQSKGRSHLAARLSTDDGATWNTGLMLDERNKVSYPDGVEDKDGVIWIVYDRDRQGAGEILIAKFKEQDVIAGKDVSGTVSLRQVVSKLDKTVLSR